jgi:hypothetical protein
MTGKKLYLQPREMILNAIHDLAGLQKAKTLISDSPNGLIRLLVTVYENEWEYNFTVKDIIGGRSEVFIELIGKKADIKRLIDHEFALLDYVLTDYTRINNDDTAL